MNRRNLTLGLSFLTGTSLLLIALTFFVPVLHSPVLIGVFIWTGFESLMAFYGLSWSLTRSHTTFLSVFAGGILFRLATIGVLAWIVSSLHVPPNVPLLGLVFAYFLLSLVQLPFLSHHGLR